MLIIWHTVTNAMPAIALAGLGTVGFTVFVLLFYKASPKANFFSSKGGLFLVFAFLLCVPLLILSRTLPNLALLYVREFFISVSMVVTFTLVWKLLDKLSAILHRLKVLAGKRMKASPRKGTFSFQGTAPTPIIERTASSRQKSKRKD